MARNRSSASEVVVEAAEEAVEVETEERVFTYPPYLSQPEHVVLLRGICDTYNSHLAYGRVLPIEWIAESLAAGTPLDTSDYPH